MNLMPTFCRHNRLVQNCPICSREQDVEMRPVVIPGGQTAPAARVRLASRHRANRTTSSRPRSGVRARGDVTVRRLSREAEDGYRSGLVPGLRSGADAERLATELAFAAARLARLAADPPGLYAEVADPGRRSEERTWLAFLIAYLGPLDGDAPFAGDRAGAHRVGLRASRRHLEDVATGPRTAYDPASAACSTIDAYRAWAQRAGSQAAAFAGEAALDARAALRPGVRAPGASGAGPRRAL